MAKEVQDVTVDIVSKTRKSRGLVSPGRSNGLKATVGVRDGVKFIRLFGTYVAFKGHKGKVVDRTFKVGDTVEYDSYNLRYLGTITNITDKRVTVQPRYGSRTKSMDLYGFTWRNYNFDLEEANEENAQTSLYI